MNTHLGPVAPLGAPRIRNLAQQRDHAQFLQQRSVERDFVQPVEDFARGAWRARSVEWIDGDEKSVLRLALADERGDRRVAGVAAIPIGLAIDLDRLEKSRKAGGRKQNLGRKLRVAKHPPATGVYVCRRHEQ